MLFEIYPPSNTFDPVCDCVFANRLKAAGAMRGLSQRALEGFLSDHKPNSGVRVNRYEQEVSRADMDTAAALARALDVPLAYLFTEEDDQAELLLAFAKLGKSQRAHALALVQELTAKPTK